MITRWSTNGCFKRCYPTDRVCIGYYMLLLRFELHASSSVPMCSLRTLPSSMCRFQVCHQNQSNRFSTRRVMTCHDCNATTAMQPFRTIQNHPASQPDTQHDSNLCQTPNLKKVPSLVGPDACAQWRLICESIAPTTTGSGKSKVIPLDLCCTSSWISQQLESRGSTSLI